MVDVVSDVDDDDNPDMNDSFKIFETPSPIIDVDIHLSDSVNDPFEYVDLVQRLSRYRADTHNVTMYLANHGGQVRTCVQLFNAIRDCKAPVHVVVVAPCYSAGAMSALAGDSLTMKRGTCLMYHNYSGGNYGKGLELHTATENTKRFIDRPI